jgi:hypothetical protein
VQHREEHGGHGPADHRLGTRLGTQKCEVGLCGVTHAQGYFDIVMVAIVGAIIALAVVILLGSVFGSF